MRVRLTAALLVLLPCATAHAEELFGRAMLSYESRDGNTSSASGFRQQYDLRLNKVLTTTSLVRLYCRIDDFRGTQDFAAIARDHRSTQIQPLAEVLWNPGTIQILARNEWLTLRSSDGDSRSTRTIQRSVGSLTWQPDELPVTHILASRNATRDESAATDLTDDSVVTSVQYHWRGLQATAEGRYFNSADAVAGYGRTTTTHAGGLSWASTHFGDKLVISADATTQFISLEESATGRTTTSVPTPLTISHALTSIDETPLDSRDHPLTANAALTDSNLSTSAGISLGPDSASFQNLAVDLGHVDRMDELRVIVRDAAGNPLQHGGGPVTWDAYTSDDGQLWRLIPSASTTFNGPLSFYSISFTLTTGRWFKVVNFGVNADPTFITELQAYYHTTIPAGSSRNGSQNNFNSATTITFQPWKQLTAAYTGIYASLRERFAGRDATTSTDLEHLVNLQYDLRHHVSLRGQLVRRTADTYTGRTDILNDTTAFIDYSPTRQLHMTLELGQQDETVQDSRFTLDTRALHITAFIIRSVSLSADAGVQTQSIAGNDAANRNYVSFTGNVQLLPSLRMLLNGTLQRIESRSSDPAVQLLGAERDERVYSDFIWRPGRQLQLSAKFGWAAGTTTSGFTQRYHADWFPFGDGTVSLAGSYDQDVDPTVNRRARRLLFNPRWLMNRWVMFDINYTSVTTSLATSSLRQRSLYATVTFTK